jgi:hypothetical protein
LAGVLVAPSGSDGVVGVDAVADSDSEVLLLLLPVLLLVLLLVVLVDGFTGNLSRVSSPGR